MSKNNGSTLGACLSSVVKSLPLDKEIIVVDAHSTDSTSEILKSFDRRIKVVYDEGKGLGAARNLGVVESTGDIVAFVDSDVICAHNHFLRIERYFEEHPDVAALDTVGKRYNVGTYVQRLDALYWQTEQKHSVHTSLRGWSLACRRIAFNAVGGFCLGYSEDVDFSNRLKAKGFKLASIETDSWHMPRKTLPAFFKEVYFGGKTEAYLDYRWSNPQLVMYIRYAISPLRGFRYLLETKKVSLYIYFILRDYIVFLGKLKGRRRMIGGEPR
jgi:glycosyltransferase involved in cell wall biosynthesis